jgi:hypothetical protein
LEDETIAMFVLYLMDNETHDYEIITRYKLPRLAETGLRESFARIRVSLLTGVMYKNESVWMVPGTVGADD